MMLSYMQTPEEELILVCLEATDLVAIARGIHVELPLRDLQTAASFEEVGHLERAKIVLLPPGASEQLLRLADEASAAGKDVRITDLREPRGPEA